MFFESMVWRNTIFFMFLEEDCNLYIESEIVKGNGGDGVVSRVERKVAWEIEGFGDTNHILDW